ncbi:MmgE/PrpD family protein [Pigmentiphaga soli]|uniref:MmgE/PrpD family protein n=1 Tax=Pigmentiphaga soli TaxID=1007095 RepID=A0ABP8GFL8_9BURK
MNATIPAAEAAANSTIVLGAWIAGLRYEDIPTAAREHAKLCLLDSVGCGLFGATLPWGAISADTAVELAPGGGASLWGSGRRAGPGATAMANGTAVHGFELDDIHVQSVFHPGATVIPAVLAVAESRGGMSGRQVLTAIVAGYEAGIRIGIAAGVGQALRGFHQTGTVGAAAAAAGVARLLDLDADAATHALGIGATQAAGLYCARMGAMAKRFHAGHAAEAGVTAGLLASRGFTGSTEVLEAPVGGFLSALGENATPSEIAHELGQRWETAKVGFKAHASCASAHTIVDGVDDLMRQGLTADNLQHMRISLSRISVNNVGWTYKPADVVAAQMNGFYTAAVKLLDGRAFVEQYLENRLTDPRILALIKRIAIEHDPELDKGGPAMRHASRVEATLVDGTTLRTYNEQRRGSYTRPLTREEVAEKFRHTAKTALGREQVEELERLLLTIDELPTLDRVSALLLG